MNKKRRFVFLSNDFYNDYPSSLYPEIERKPLRPYIQMLAIVDNYTFAIPLRSNINHPHVFWTDKDNRCGIDFSKAVIITDEKYIDESKTPHIRQKEFDALRGKDFRISQRMKQYIEDYKKAKEKGDDIASVNLVNKSTLQYYENYIFGKDDCDRKCNTSE